MPEASDQQCELIRKAAELLILLRTPRTRRELQDALGGVSRFTIMRWLRAMKKVIPVKKRVKYTGGKGKRTVKYYWEQGLLPVKSSYASIKSLESCLCRLGAPEEEIKTAKNDLTTAELKGWIHMLFRDRIKEHPPLTSSPEVVRTYIEAKDRACYILSWR